MPHFVFYGTQRFFFTCKLNLQEFLSTPQLIEDSRRRSLPGKGHPSEKGRAGALVGPVFTLKRLQSCTSSLA